MRLLCALLGHKWQRYFTWPRIFECRHCLRCERFEVMTLVGWHEAMYDAFMGEYGPTVGPTLFER